MKLTELSKTYEGQWGYSIPKLAKVYSCPEELLRDYQPYIRIERPLVEATYKELMQLIDPDFLLQGQRAAELQGVYLDKIEREWAGGRVSAFDPEDTMNFLVPSSEHDENGVDYLSLVKFEDWDRIGSDPDLTIREKALGVIWTSNVRLWCGCPSFLFWGYQNILTTFDSSIYPEGRRPVIRNWGTTRYGPPQERGCVCKHLNRVLHVLGAHWADIGKEIREQFGQPVNA